MSGNYSEYIFNIVLSLLLKNILKMNIQYIEKTCKKIKKIRIYELFEEISNSQDGSPGSHEL